MTAIAALVDEKGTVWIGGDSAGTNSWLQSQPRKDPKVFKNGDFLIGYTSSFRMGQLLRFEFSPPNPHEGIDGYEYMVTQFIPAVRRLFKDGGYLQKESEKESGGEFIVGWRGRLFIVHSDFQVAEFLLSYAACGCGGDIVKGSLHTTASLSASKKIAPKTRIEMALEAAEEFSAGVRGPFVILNSAQ